MSDDWRRRDPDDLDDFDDFGGSLFDDPADSATGQQRRLSFGDDSGALPHWSSPPTGEIPRIDVASVPVDDDEDVDVWSTFTTESPVWRDDLDDSTRPTGVLPQIDPNASGPIPRAAGRDPSGPVPRSAGRDPSGPIPRSTGRDPSGSVPRVGDVDRSGEYPVVRRDDPSGELFADFGAYGDDSGALPRRDRTGEVGAVGPRDPARITIGTDPSGMPRRAPDNRGRRTSGRAAGGVRTGRAGVPPRRRPTDQRDMRAAIIVGAGLAAGFIAALMLSDLAVALIIAAVLGVGAFEYFGKITEKGYRPSVVIGLAAAVGAPLATYWVGETAIPLVIALAFIGAAVGFIAAPGVESGPLPNMAVTTMGIVWIAILGSFAGALLHTGSGSTFATDTLFLVALGVAANDIGALAVGSVAGKTPLRPWISPGKTLEGLIGGTAATFAAIFLAAQIVPDANVWGWSIKWPLLLALVISVFAPLGDLTESMFKRNLEIKDFGTVVAGHGGVLDRFDGFLFVLPAVYYLCDFMLKSIATGGLRIPASLLGF